MGILNRAKPLSDVPRFGALSEVQMREVCDAGREVSVPERWSLIAESTPPDQAYLVIEGRLQVVHKGQQIAELGRGDIVGEMGLTGHRLRTGTVTALTPVVLLHLPGTAFKDLYQRIPAFRSAVDETIATRLGEQ